MEWTDAFKPDLELIVGSLLTACGSNQHSFSYGRLYYLALWMFYGWSQIPGKMVTELAVIRGLSYYTSLLFSKPSVVDVLEYPSKLSVPQFE